MREEIRIRHAVLGTGVEIISWVVGMTMPATQFLAFVGGVGGLVLIYIGLAPWLKTQFERIPIPEGAAPRFKSIWLWYLYQPIIEVSQEMDTHKGIHDKHFEFRISPVIHLQTIFPYGETEIDFSGSRLMVYQQRNAFVFNCRGDYLEQRIGAPESHDNFSDFILTQAKDEQVLFDEDMEFRWCLHNVAVTLRGRDNYLAAGTIPKISGRKRGTR